ncbi:MAG: hypothetical protein KKH98_10215, partial [Spirochaetes bacterium]|nr:hypothetical protein [Spirochaetota bacterium]
MSKDKILLGELLIEKKLISREDLEKALDLVKKKLITQTELEKALELIKKTGYRLGHSLIQLGLIDDKTLAKILTEQYNQECIVVEDVHVPVDILNKI